MTVADHSILMVTGRLNNARFPFYPLFKKRAEAQLALLDRFAHIQSPKCAAQPFLCVFLGSMKGFVVVKPLAWVLFLVVFAIQRSVG
jgi:hypothetical protein